MVYDGQYAFRYDAWNRMAAVKRAYRNGDGSLSLTSTVGTISYDGLGRRICKDVSNSADWNYTYHYYHNGQSCVEERNGAGQTIRQHVWGLTYIDELVQTGINQDPSDGESAAGGADTSGRDDAARTGRRPGRLHRRRPVEFHRHAVLPLTAGRATRIEPRRRPSARGG